MLGCRSISFVARRLRARSARLALAVGLFVMAAASYAADTFLFGPQTFQGTGSGVLTTRSFSVAAGGDGYVLRVRNNGVTLAIVALNSQIVLQPQDFGAVFPTSGSEDWRTLWQRLLREFRTLTPGTPVPLIEKPVTLRSGRNDLVIAFVAPRGKSFSLEVVKPGGTHTTPPVITTSVTPVPNGNGWNNTPVTVTFTGADSGSGIAICPAPVTTSTDGRDQVITGTATDIAGNIASASVTLNIDRTPPVVTAAMAPSANGNGWNNTPVVVSFVATDALSGVNPTSVTAPVTLAADGTNLSATGQATDLAGNVGTVTLTQGANSISALATDAAGNTNAAPWAITVTPPTGPPVLTLTVVQPSNGAIIGQSPVTVRGSISDPTARVAVQGVIASVVGTTVEARNIALSEGRNDVVVRATTIGGQQATSTVTPRSIAPLPR